MSGTVYDRKKAIRYTAAWSILFILAVIGLVTRETWWGFVLMLAVVLWTVGGVTYCYRAITHGFVDPDDEPDEAQDSN